MASFTFMAFLNLTGLIEMVKVVEYFCILTKVTIEGFFVEINLRKKSGSFAAHRIENVLDIKTFERN